MVKCSVYVFSLLEEMAPEEATLDLLLDHVDLYITIKGVFGVSSSDKRSCF